MREDLRERLAGMGIGDQRGDLDAGMAGGEPDQVGAGIAGGAEHRGPDLGLCSHGRNFRTNARRVPSPDAGLAEFEAL